ncbi:retrotransposon protein, putative, ty1-copia subclass [Tanacetum coccineum]
MERLGYSHAFVNWDVNLILFTLKGIYDQKFMQNYNMHGMGKTIPELHAMLKLAEKSIPKKTPAVLAIRQGQIQKPKSQARGKGKQRGKGKGKLAYDPKHKIPPPAKNEHPAKDTKCHYCIFTMELFSFPKSNSWIYDSGCGTHICNTIEGLRGYRKLNKGALDLYVPNGNTAAVKAIGSFDLILPSGMILLLYNFSKDNIVYFNAFPHDGIFETDMHNHMSNERFIYTCSNKKIKHNLDSTFLRHCRLSHINKKRIEKLQHDGLLESIDDESFDTCVSYISGKMERKPFTHVIKRADDLLGIIHSDVYGAFRTTSREGANYYVTFTDDFSRYGYPKKTMGYYFYYPLENKFFIARYAEFFKTRLIKQEASGSTVDFDEIQSEDAQPSENISLHQSEVELDSVEPQTDVIPVRRSARIAQDPERYGPEFKKWLEAINTEMQSMKDNQVWNLVDLPPNCKTVESKELFKKKTDMDGNIHTYEARLIAKGFTQTYGVDYEETFSPVADIKAIRILIAIAAYYDYEIWQMDHPRRVSKLQRSIYGLNQASKSRNKRFDEEIKTYGFTQNPDESCVYKRASGSIIVFLILYVDDILLMGNNISMLQDVKSWLGKCFAMKDLGEAAYILGIKIYRDRSRRLIGLSQNAYIDKILKRFKMDTSKRGTILMQPNVDLRKSQGPSTPTEVKRMKGIPYASAVGSIMYAVRCTRPDVAFSQNLTSRYQQNPGESHWTAMKNILKYLRNTKDMFLIYGGDSTTELGITCYTDASWETDRDDLRSQTGFVFVMNGGAVDWKSSKQSTTAMSSMEAEYIAAAEAAMEAIWIRKFISGLGVVPSIDKPMDMYCDNTGTDIQKGLKTKRTKTTKRDTE